VGSAGDGDPDRGDRGLAVRGDRHAPSVNAVTDVRLSTLSREQFLAAITGSRRARHVADAVIDERLQANRSPEI